MLSFLNLRKLKFEGTIKSFNLFNKDNDFYIDDDLTYFGNFYDCSSGFLSVNGFGLVNLFDFRYLFGLKIRLTASLN